MKRIVLGVSAVVFLCLALVLDGCSKGGGGGGPAAPVLVKNNPQWAEYVAEHSTGLTSRVAQLRVRFVADAVPESEVGKPLAGLVVLSPELEASAVFNTPRELVIVPAKPLPSGRQVLVALKVAALSSLPQALGDFKFVIDVTPQDAAFAISAITAPDGEAGRMQVEGSIVTTDVADADAVEKVVQAKLAGTDVALTWTHDSENRSHGFITTAVERGEATRELLLTWDAAPIGGLSKGERKVEIPARNAFVVTRVDRVIGDQPRIQVSFSEPLAPRQNLSGLVAVSSGDSTVRLDGNTLEIFPSQTPTGEVTVTIDATLRAADGRQLGAEHRRTVMFETLKPQVRFVGNGTILPDAERLTIPFEAVNVASVQVTAFRVYDKNLGQFLQVNPLSGTQEMRRVGRYLWRKTVPLGAGAMNQWHRFAFDATELFRGDPGGLFQLTISINRGNSLYGCSEADRAVPVPAEAPLKNGDEYQERDGSGWDGIEEYYDGDGGYWSSERWRDRENPCKDAYFTYARETKAARNFVAANLGLLAKAGSDNALRFVVTDIRGGKPQSGADVRLFNFQGMEIARGSSDGEGMLTLKPEVRAFYAMAEKGGQRGYLKLADGTALPTSHFDVGGVRVERGVKGTIFGERGVWRPGDDVHLTFVLQDPQDAVPDDHPATLELINPTGQTVHTEVVSAPVGGFYAFHVSTKEQDQTGDWRAVVKLGGRTFERAVKIETIMPNRLKVELDTGKGVMSVADAPKLSLFAEWLHGASASGLRADVKVRLRPTATRFSRATDFVFDDPTRRYEGDEQTLFEGELDEQGKASFSADIVPEGRAAGALSANFTTRVFEPSGAFSIATQGATFHPYRAYLGLRMPKGDAARDMLLTDIDHVVEVASLDPEGKPVSVGKVDFTVYKLQWRWWWQQGDESFAEFGSGNAHQVVAEGSTTTKDGAGRFTFKVKYPDWGRYLIRACDAEGGHCTGSIRFIDWPGWAGRAQEQSGPGANALTLYSDKQSYTVGETATINLPPATKGRALISIENGSGILSQRWLELGGERSSFELPITPELAPNAYASVTLVQPHEGKDNDRPIRLYGVLPLLVSDPATHLDPTLQAPDTVRPNSTLKLAVGEAKGRPMTYVVQVVDEGLLGLTNHRTPDLHAEFYRREALGVRTWDMFDDVVGAYGGALERLLAIGGSDEGPRNDQNKERKRFPPVVRVLGPFQLKAGETAQHDVPLPSYVGAVRVMVVAGRQGAYGSEQKSITVKQPVMVQATVPRVIGPGEELRVPVSVFVLEDAIAEVAVSASIDERLKLIGEGSVKLAFGRAGDKLGFFRFKVGDRLGKTRLRFAAAAGKERAEHVIDVEVRAPNPAATAVQRLTIEAGQTWSGSVEPIGLPGTNETMLEASAIPSFDLDGRLSHLIRYPHGCIEQTTSAAFPQLYLGKLMALDEALAKRSQGNVAAGIDRLRLFQQSNGAFAYWPGQGGGDAWATSYAGHFLVEAQRAGYVVPASMLQPWRNWQRGKAQTWVGMGERGAELDQAYRLYVLALAGSPELGAMNRMREQAGVDAAARLLLAGAYKLAGLGDVATTLAKGVTPTPRRYEQEGPTFGSELRDRAIMLESMNLIGDQVRAKDLADAVAKDLNSNGWHSTQTLSWSLIALGHFVGDSVKDGLRFDHSLSGGAWVSKESTTPLALLPLAVGDKPAKLSVANRGKGRMWVNLSTRGIPAVGEEKAESAGLELSARFEDAEGGAIVVDALPQGRDLVAVVKVRNTGSIPLDNLALVQLMPSGWEIAAVRERLEGESAYDYRDFRDDRVLTYFPLKAGETRTFMVRLHSAYPGRYYLPAWSVEAMYDAKHHARSAGRWVTVGDDKTD